METNREFVLRCLLDCGSLDLSLLDDVEYDIGEIIEELEFEGVKLNLQNIIVAVFEKGVQEIEEGIQSKIDELENDKKSFEEDEDTDCLDYAETCTMIDELKSLDPDNDIEWFFNFLDTSIYFVDGEEEAYRSLIPDIIEEAESNMGFSF